MGFAGKKLPLEEIQKCLLVEADKVHVISDMHITEEDYKCLAAKIKMLLKFTNEINVLDDFKLSIIVYWVFSMVYWDHNHLDELEMDVIFEGLPQYKKKYYLNICMEAFDDYGIYKYNDNYEDMYYHARAVVARHSSIPDDEKDDAFRIISQYLDCSAVADMTEKVLLQFPDKSKTIFCFFDDETKQRVICEIRNLIIDCHSGNYNVEYLYDKYQYVSRRLVNRCIEWVNQESQISRRYH